MAQELSKADDPKKVDPTEGIYKILSQWGNSEGKKIVQIRFDDGETVFMGHMVVTSRVMGTSVTVPFRIPAKNYKQAFKRFEAEAKKVLDKAKEKIDAEMRKPRLELPGVDNRPDIGTILSEASEE